MNILKQTYAVVAIVAMMLCPQSVWAEDHAHSFTYSIQNGSYHIECTCGQVVSPSRAVLYTVTSGDAVATSIPNVYNKVIDGKGVLIFNYNEDLFEIPSGCFATRSKSNLLSVILPKTVTKISEKAFYMCSSLQSIELPTSVKAIGQNAFNTGGILTATLHSLPEIYTNSFSDSNSKKIKIILDDNSYVDAQGYAEFSSFSSIKYTKCVNGNWGSAILPFKSTCQTSNVKIYTVENFITAGDNGSIMLKEVNVVEKNTPFFYQILDNSLTEVEFINYEKDYQAPSNNIFISKGGFDLVGTFEASDLSSNVSKTIFVHSGSDLTKLTSTLQVKPFSVWVEKTGESNIIFTLVDEYGVINYQTSDGYPIALSVTTLGSAMVLNSGVYNGTDWQILLSGEVTSIEDGAFQGLTNLKSIDLSSVVSIGANAFKGCTALESVTLSDDLTSIGDGVFEGCSSLGSVSLNFYTTSIGANAFKGCIDLQNVTIPFSATTIGNSAFEGCTGLRSCTFEGDKVNSLGEGAFKGCTQLTNFEVPGKVSMIKPSLFEGCTNLSTIDIKGGISSIGDRAFFGSGLTKISLTGELNAIGERAFANSDLQTIEFSSYPAIDATAFEGCTALSKVDVVLNDDSYLSFNCEGFDAVLTLVENNSGKTTGKYTRDLKGTTSVWGTAIMPFEVASTEKIQYYQLVNAGAESLTFSPVETVAANTPFVFQREKDNSEQFDIAGNNVANVTTGISSSSRVDGYALKGAYEDVSSLKDIYFFSHDQFFRADDPVTVKKFRGWIDASESSAASLRILVNKSENETSILEINEDGSLQDVTEGIYDIQGLKLDAPVKGKVNIINGKKFFVK